MPEIIPKRRYATKSLVSASLEIGRVLADRDGVTFRVTGTCMYPTIRPGDVLRVQSRIAGDISVGDIAVCRQASYMFSHRVVAKGVENGRNYIVTLPDRTPDSRDDPTFDENLLGVVVSIERKGRSVPLQPAVLSWPVRIYHGLRLFLMDISGRMHYRWLALLERVQDNGLYKRLARKWLSNRSSQIAFSVRLPMPALGDAIYRQMSAEAFNVQMDWMGRPVERWTLTLHLDGARDAAAWIAVARDADDEWSEGEIFVGRPYRGTGMEDMLLRRVDAILQATHHEAEMKVEKVDPARASCERPPVSQ